MRWVLPAVRKAAHLRYVVVESIMQYQALPQCSLLTFVEVVTFYLNQSSKFWAFQSPSTWDQVIILSIILPPVATISQRYSLCMRAQAVK